MWPQDNPGIATTLRQIGMGYQMCSQHDRAEQIYRRALEIDTKAQGMKSLDVASDLVSLARVSMSRKDLPAAELFFEQALATNQLRGDKLAQSQNLKDLAMVAGTQNQPERADPYLAQAVAILKTEPDKYSTQITNILTDRANIASSRQDYNSAIDDLKQALLIQQTSPHPSPIVIVATLSDVGSMYSRSGDFSSAEQYFHQAIQLSETDQAISGDPVRALPFTHLAHLYIRQKKFPEAESSLMRAMEITANARGADSPAMAPPNVELAELYVAQDRNVEAEAHYRRAIELAESQQGLYYHELPQILAEYARLLRKLNRNAEADQLMQRAKDIQASFGQPPQPAPVQN
jgi:tetratricopeptide (TPR) repeat protein